MRDEYKGYREWKQWGKFGRVSAAEAGYFRRELRRLPPLAGQSVLEIGFGRGNFLKFASDQRAEVYGTELIPELLADARESGFRVSETHELFADPQSLGSFDLVLAFDVIEHLDKADLQEFFAAVQRLLKPGGTFLARFPNGHSPFGRLYQYGDLTHKSIISGRGIEHLAALTGFELVEVRNPRMQFVGNPLVWTAQVLQRGLRDFVEIVVGYTYFNRRLPLDPNLVAHLQKPAAGISS
jgi:cyclopropane fatty-acyl-phospholipid synthase-like methyltransferase